MDVKKILYLVFAVLMLCLAAASFQALQSVALESGSPGGAGMAFSPGGSADLTVQGVLATLLLTVRRPADGGTVSIDITGLDVTSADASGFGAVQPGFRYGRAGGGQRTAGGEPEHESRRGRLSVTDSSGNWALDPGKSVVYPGPRQ